MFALSTLRWCWQYSYAKMLTKTPDPTAQFADFGIGAVHAPISPYPATFSAAYTKSRATHLQ